MPKIVIVGAGFAGLFAARGLRRTQTDITLIDQHNYHLLQPLLYQVATAGLAPSDRLADPGRTEQPEKYHGVVRLRPRCGCRRQLGVDRPAACSV